MTHKIKIKKKYYDAVLSGDKTFEVRKNDRDYKVGDTIQFVPVADDGNMIIPHNTNEYKITYVFHGGEYGLEEGYCVFGIAPTYCVFSGEWKTDRFGLDRSVCSICGAVYEEKGGNFCANCGAKMKGGAE